MSHSLYADRPAAGRRERSRADPVLRCAIGNVRDNIAALPASDVVQLALWPQSLAAWARDTGEDESQVSNLFRRYRTYGRLRGALADRLQVSVPVLAHLIEARPAQPRPFRRAADGGDESGAVDAVTSAAESPPPLADWPAEPPYPAGRNGANPIEREALVRLESDCAAMPASRIVGLALWPDTITSWAKSTGRCAPGQLMTALSGLRRAPRAEIALARRLHVSVRALDDFIDSVKAESVWRRPRAAAAPADVTGLDESPVRRSPSTVDVEQRTLDL